MELIFGLMLALIGSVFTVYSEITKNKVKIDKEQEKLNEALRKQIKEERKKLEKMERQITRPRHKQYKIQHTIYLNHLKEN